MLELNGKRFPGVWPSEVSLGRAAAAAGRKDEALRHLRAALKQPPDEGNRKNLEQAIGKVEKGEAID